MLPLPPNLKSPSVADRLLLGLRSQQRNLRKLSARVGRGMATDVTRDGVPVIFIHNPRAGGRSLEKLFNVQHLSHAFPKEKLTEKLWLSHFVVTSVRHPLDRFFSGYFGNVRSDWSGSLVRKYGPGIKELRPIEFLAVIQREPRNTGPQVQWTDFPSKRKPRADLVLKLEEVGDWENRIRAAGVEIGERDLPHIGKSANSAGRQADLLNMPPSEYAEVREAVETYYAEDYDAFGYPRGPT